MTAYSRRGFRVRLILDKYNDHRKKCFFFVNILRDRLVRNVMQKIWHYFYKEHCSSHDDIFLEIDGFFVPPGESTLVLKENDVISVHVRKHAAAAGTTPSSSAVRSTLAPLTAAPGTLVESVALVLRRLQNGDVPEDSEKSERERLNKVAEMMAAESGSTDVSTDEEDVRGMGSQLTSQQEVVRLSQKMVDQATPPPPCAAKKHDLDSEHLTLTEVSRELRRRYEAGRQPSSTTADASTGVVAGATEAVPPSVGKAPIAAVASAAAAAASPGMSISSLDSSESLLEMVKVLEAAAETGGASTDPGASTGSTGATSTPFTTPATGAKKAPTVPGVETMEDGPGDGGGVESPTAGVVRRGPKPGVVKVVTTYGTSNAIQARSEEVPATATPKPSLVNLYPHGIGGDVKLQCVGVVRRGAKRIAMVPLNILSKFMSENPGAQIHPLDDFKKKFGNKKSQPVSAEPGKQTSAESSKPKTTQGAAENSVSMMGSTTRKDVVETKESGRKRAKRETADEGAQAATVTPVLKSTEHRDVSKWDLRASAQPPVPKPTVGGDSTSGSEEDESDIQPSQVINEAKMQEVRAAGAGVKRARSPSSDSSECSSVEDTPVKPTPVKKSASSSSEEEEEEDTPAKKTSDKKSATTPNTTTPNTTAATSDGASTDKKKKTRTRRRRGKKRRTPEAPLCPPPPPPPQPRAVEYSQRHGLPRGEIDRYKRAASVGIGWQTRPKNRRVVFDDEGNMVPCGGEASPSTHPAAATGRSWRNMTTQGGDNQWSWSRGGRQQEQRSDNQWSWSQGRRQEQSADDSRSARHQEGSQHEDKAQSAVYQSGCSGQKENAEAPETNSSTSVADVVNSGTPSQESYNSHNRTPAKPSPDENAPKTKSLATAQATAATKVADSICDSSVQKTENATSQKKDPTNVTTDTPSNASAARSGYSALGGGGSRGSRSGSLGAGLLPRAFMRPRRCVDPPRRAEVLGKPEVKSTPAKMSGSNRDSVEGRDVSSTGSDKLLMPGYLLKSRAADVRAASLAAAKKEADRNATPSADGEGGTTVSETRIQSRRSESDSAPAASRLSDTSSRDHDPSDRQKPSPVEHTPSSTPASKVVSRTLVSTSATSAITLTPNVQTIIDHVPASSIRQPSRSTPTSAPASAPVSSTRLPSRSAIPLNFRTPVSASRATVVLDERGQPAEKNAGCDLLHLASSAERRPLVVVRRDRPLPGRVPYREATKQDVQRDGGVAEARSRADADCDVKAGRGDVANAERTPKPSQEQHSEPDVSENLGNGGSVQSEIRSVLDDDEEDVEDDVASPSRDEYRNVSVILPGPPLEQLSPHRSSSGESASSDDDSGASNDDRSEASEEDADDWRDYEDEPEYSTAPSTQRDASVDSITNCNVVNAVGQNRRLEKQRARGLPPGSDKENCAPGGDVKDEAFYSQFPLMKDVAHKGDLIAFKCWDMAADYTPYVSEYREASVLEVGADGRLTLQLIEYRPRGRRRGRFEITSPDDDEVVDLEEESGLEERRWCELIQPRLVHP